MSIELYFPSMARLFSAYERTAASANARSHHSRGLSDFAQTLGLHHHGYEKQQLVILAVLNKQTCKQAGQCFNVHSLGPLCSALTEFLGKFRNGPTPVPADG